MHGRIRRSHITAVHNGYQVDPTDHVKLENLPQLWTEDASEHMNEHGG